MKFLPTICLAALFLPVTLAQQGCTFIQIVMDESGSMETEQEFLKDSAMPNVIEDLRIRFSQQVFVCAWGFAYTNRNRIAFSGRPLGCSIGFDTNDYKFVSNGGTEDGYAAMKAADQFVQTLTQIDGTPLSSCASINYYMILATDEDRDNTDPSLSYATTLKMLQDGGWTLHAIVNNPINGGNGIGAVEESTNRWKVYSADIDPNTPSKYTETIVTLDPVGSGPGKPDYSPLAFATDGAVWDLEKLRVGGFTAASFADAFVNITIGIIGDDVSPSAKPSQTPSASPSKSHEPTISAAPIGQPSKKPSRKPTSSPITAAPSSQPDLCNSNVVLTCVKNGGEAAVRAIMTVFLKGILTDAEIGFVIPPLADELVTVAIQKEIQKQACLYLQNPKTYNVANGGVAIFQALLGSINLQRLAQVTYNAIVANVDLSAARLAKLLLDLTNKFTTGLNANSFTVSGVIQLLVSSLQDITKSCMNLNLPAPPTPAPPPANSGGGFLSKLCFSDQVTLDEKERGTIRMDQLKIGDSVRTANGSYSKVYGFGHYSPELEAEFLQILTAEMENFLEITGEHFIYVYDMSKQATRLVPAKLVKVGDALVSEHGYSKVISVQTVQRRGLYDPLTTTGDILVNGVAASNYVSIPAFKNRLSYDRQHWVEHASAAPYRLYCAWFDNGACQSETYDELGHPKVVTFWLSVLTWMERQIALVQDLFLYVLIMPSHWLVLTLEQVTRTFYWQSLLIASVVGYTFMLNGKKKESVGKY